MITYELFPTVAMSSECTHLVMSSFQMWRSLVNVYKTTSTLASLVNILKLMLTVAVPSKYFELIDIVAGPSKCM